MTEEDKRKAIIFGICVAVTTLFVAKAIAFLFEVNFSWGSATMIGAILASFAMAGRLNKISDADTRSVVGAENDALETVSLPRVELKKVQFWFDVTTWLMYPLLLLCAYETNKSENYTFGSIWILAGLLYFYSYHRLRDLIKK